MKRILGICILILLASLLPAQDFFTLALVLEEVRYAGNGSWFWKPDWPLELPPDSFKTRVGECSGINVEVEGQSFNVEYDTGGRLEKFPFMLGGRMVCIDVDYGESSEISKMVLTFIFGNESWELEFLEYRDSFPFLVRASCGDAWYFISLSKGGNAIMETWYDEEGNVLTSYGYTLTDIGRDKRIMSIRDYSKPGDVTEYFYDSRCLLSEISGQDEIFSVLYYRDDLPRYCERRPQDGVSLVFDPAEKFSFQWDKSGLLFRIVRVEEASLETDSPVEYRYEYSFDDTGNWTERREIRMFRRFGLLFPSQGTTVKRVLEYK